MDLIRRHILCRAEDRDRGAALVEFALILPILLILLLGIIDFGLYFYNDLQLTHAARDAARRASVNDVVGANAAIDAATFVSTTDVTRSVTVGASGMDVTVTLTAVYHAITPLPVLIGMGSTINIDASTIMRRE